MASTQNSPAATEDGSKGESRTRLAHAYRIGLGMILADLRFALIAFAALAAAPIAGVLTAPTPPQALALVGLNALAQCTVIYLITVRWYRFLGSSSITVSRRIIPTVGFGFALWLILRGPFLIMQTARVSEPWAAILYLVLAPAAYFNLKYFFYHIPLAAGWRGSLHESFSFAARITNANLLLPVRVLIGPAAVVSLLTALIGGASPDGRELWVAASIAGIEQLFWVLTPYLSCAYAAFLIPEQDWRDLGLDPYRSARMTTLTVQGPEFFSNLFRPRNALILFIISLFIWLGNLSRVAEMPPAVSIKILRIAVGERSAEIDLALSGSSHDFRGFSPQFFRLAGDQGTSISDAPPITELSFNPGDTTGTVKLRFSTDKSEEEIRRIKDLHLWYLRARLTPLDTAGAAALRIPGPDK